MNDTKYSCNIFTCRGPIFSECAPADQVQRRHHGFAAVPTVLAQDRQVGVLLRPRCSEQLPAVPIEVHVYLSRRILFVELKRAVET